MTETEIIFFAIKLILGGLIAFLAIMLWSRTRELAWMLLVLAAVTGYSALVYDLLLRLGFVTSREIMLFGNELPLIKLILSIVPSLFVILAFLRMLFKTGRNK